MSNDHVWVVAAAIFAGVTLLLYILKEIIPFTFRFFIRKLRGSFDACFTIAAYNQALLKYVIQDDYEHQTRRLEVPSNEEIYLQLLIHTNTYFTQRNIVVGFDKINRVNHPLIDHYKLFFIKRGQSEKHPEIEKTHWIDHNDNYHIVEERDRGSGEFFTLGFIIKTRDPGNFRMKIEIATDNREEMRALDFIVKSDHREKVKCTKHFGCWVSPKN